MTDDELKSAYELAMERLQSEDEKEGRQSRPLTPAQKKKITRLREEARAKLAELEILHEKQVAVETDPAKLVEIEEHYRIDRSRVESSVNSKIAAVKSAAAKM